jgi:hypothetical protein
MRALSWTLFIALLGLFACNPRQTPRQESPDLPNISDCVEVDNPNGVAWMEAALERHRTYEIIRYTYLDGWGYYFLTGPVSYFYDCQGTLICETPGKALNECARMVQTLGKGMKIYTNE